MTAPSINVTLSDTNSAAAALMPNSTTFLKRESTIRVQASFSAGSGATLTRAEAYFSGSATIGKQTRTLSGSSANATFDFPNVSMHGLTIDCYNSLGERTTQAIQYTLIPYTRPSVSLKVERSGTSMNVLRCTVSGRFHSGNFGSGTSNNQGRIEFAVKAKSSYSPTADKTKTVTADNYSYTVDLNAVADPTKEYEVTAKIYDSYMNTSVTVAVAKALPSAAIFPTHFDVFGQLHIHDQNTPSTVATLSVGQLAKLLDLAGIELRSATFTINCPANSSEDFRVNWSSPFSDSDYAVSVTRYLKNSNYYRHVEEVVTRTYAGYCTLHVENDNANAVTQTYMVIGIKLPYAWTNDGQTVNNSPQS